VLTIFTVPKPFDGHIAVIQRNAIRSWRRLRPECQVVLCGDEPGTQAAATELGVERIRDIAHNEFGTPLVSSVFRAAEERAAFRLLCYVNADIVLLPDFLDAVRRLAAAKRRFLMVGQRWDVEVAEEIPPDVETWEPDWRQRAEGAGNRHPPWGSDYFVFPRRTIRRLPDFAVGRPGWDNWMIYHARTRRIPVVDATCSALVIHQNHGYGHVPRGRGETSDGPEAARNRALLGPVERVFTLSDATHRLTSAGLQPVMGWTVDDITRRLEVERIISAPLLKPPLRALCVLWGAARAAMHNRSA
jgi:hypothetical protein